MLSGEYPLASIYINVSLYVSSNACSRHTQVLFDIYADLKYCRQEVRTIVPLGKCDLNVTVTYSLSAESQI